MTREKIFEVIMQSEYEDIRAIAKSLAEIVPHSVVKKPQQELVMFRAEESVERLDFNVGEILVTSAEVRVDDAIGYSMVMDANPDKALDCALLMGIYEAGLPARAEVETLADTLLAKMEAGLRDEREIVSSTRVNFELMGGQDPNVSHNRPEGE